MTITSCLTCHGYGLVPSTDDYNEEGPSWLSCPDCDWPKDPKYQAKQDRSSQ